MKMKINNPIHKLSEFIPEHLRIRKHHQDKPFHLHISAIGLAKENVKFDEEEGIIIVDGLHNIVIEESDRYCPWNRYSTYGFYRSVILPENVKVKDIYFEVDDKGLNLGWQE